MNPHRIEMRMQNREMEDKEFMEAGRADFPEWHERMTAITQILEEDHCLVMIFVDASGIGKIETYYGKNVYEDVLAKIKGIIADLQGKMIRRNDIITCNTKKGSLFFIFLSQKREKKNFHSSDFEAVSRRISEALNQGMTAILDPLVRKRLQIQVGYAIALRNPLLDTERIVGRMIEDAKKMAHYQNYMIANHSKAALQEVILKKELRTVFQPIVDLKNMSIIGYEALTRGPAGTEMESPLILFDVARESGLQFELDRLCRKIALSHAREMKKGMKLFVNLLPMTISDPDFEKGDLKEILESKDISPFNIVFEVSENQAIENFPIFKEESRKYTDQGFSIAIDDAGTGYSNFKSLMELRMQFIKLDITLIKGLHHSDIKRQIVRSMMGIAKTIGASIIAEGIETLDDLKALIALGVPYGQGYLLARPGFPFPEIHIPEV